jgi:hypothetical protein
MPEKIHHSPSVSGQRKRTTQSPVSSQPALPASLSPLRCTDSASQSTQRSSATPPNSIGSNTNPVQLVRDPQTPDELNEEYSNMTSGNVGLGTMFDNAVRHPDFSGHTAENPDRQKALAKDVYSTQEGASHPRAIGRFGPARDVAVARDSNAVLNVPKDVENGRNQSGWNHAVNALFVQGGIDRKQVFHIWGSLTVPEQKSIARAKDFSSLNTDLKRKMKKKNATSKKAQTRHPNLTNDEGASITAGELLQLRNNDYHTGTVVGQSKLLEESAHQDASSHGHHEAHPSLRGLAEAQAQGSKSVLSGSVFPELLSKPNASQTPNPGVRSKAILDQAHVGELTDDMLGEGSGIGRKT